MGKSVWRAPSQTLEGPVGEIRPGLLISGSGVSTVSSTGFGTTKAALVVEATAVRCTTHSFGRMHDFAIAGDGRVRRIPVDDL